MLYYKIIFDVIGFVLCGYDELVVGSNEDNLVNVFFF